MTDNSNARDWGGKWVGPTIMVIWSIIVALIIAWQKGHLL